MNDSKASLGSEKEYSDQLVMSAMGDSLAAPIQRIFYP